MRRLLLLTGLLLAGCQTDKPDDANIYGSPNGQKIVGNDAYVTIYNVWSEMDALPLAQGHCEKYGKTARFNHMERIRAIFDCVAR